MAGASDISDSDISDHDRRAILVDRIISDGAFASRVAGLVRKAKGIPRPEKEKAPKSVAAPVVRPAKALEVALAQGTVTALQFTDACVAAGKDAVKGALQAIADGEGELGAAADRVLKDAEPFDKNAISMIKTPGLRLAVMAKLSEREKVRTAADAETVRGSWLRTGEILGFVRALAEKGFRKDLQPAARRVINAVKQGEPDARERLVEELSKDTSLLNGVARWVKKKTSEAPTASTDELQRYLNGRSVPEERLRGVLRAIARGDHKHPLTKSEGVQTQAAGVIQALGGRNGLDGSDGIRIVAALDEKQFAQLRGVLMRVIRSVKFAKCLYW